MAFGQISVEKPFWIGRADGKDFWTNIAIKHEKGILKNEDLLKMSNNVLESLCTDGNSIITEEYHRPNDRKQAENQGGYPNEIYIGVHRAHVILEYRKAKKKEQWNELQQDQKEALNSLVFSQ